MYSQIIHIDGPDKTGKDTVRDMLVKKAKGNYLVYVRSYISQIVYSRLYNRKINETFFWNALIQDYSNGSKFFLLTCSEEQAAERFIKHDEKDIKITEFVKHQKAFLKFAEEAASKGITINIIDTSHITPEDSVNALEMHVRNTNVSTCTNCKLCIGPVYKINSVSYSSKPEILVLSSANLEIGTDIYDLIRHSLLEAGVLEKCYISNAVKCSVRFKDSPGKVNSQNYKDCSFHLKHEIEMIQPKIILTLGNDINEFVKTEKLYQAHKIIAAQSPAVIKFGKITQEDYINSIKKVFNK